LSRSKVVYHAAPATDRPIHRPIPSNPQK
jgi:hypothetical protein